MADLVRGGVDREQVRRDAEAWKGADALHGALGIMSRHCLALLAELEQAEKEQDDLQTRIDARIEEDGVHRVYDEMHARALAAERELTLALNDVTTLRTVVADLEARLAKVPALVEALRNLAGELDEDAKTWGADHHPESTLDARERALAALAEWERG